MEILRLYATVTTVQFPLITRDAADFDATPITFASGDTQISKAGGAFANTTNNPTHLGNGIYSLTVTGTELTATFAVITIIDQTVPKAFEDQTVLIRTFGHASATYGFQLDSVAPNVNVLQISGDATAADNCEAFFDGAGYAGGTIKLGVDTVAISGDTTAADNCEAFFDGAGYAGGTIKLGVNVAQWSGTNVAAVDTAGYPKVTIKSGTGTGEISMASGIVNSNAVQISGDTTAADNCEAMFDGTGYAGGTIRLNVNTDTLTNGSITASKFGAGAIDNTALGAGAISSGKFAASAITASVIAADAIGASELAADAITEIAAAVWGSSTGTYTDAGTFGGEIIVTGDTLDANVTQIAGDGAAAAFLAASASSMEIGEAIAGTLSSTQMSTDLFETTDDHYVGRIVVFTSGDLTRCVVEITAYDGTTKVLTFTETPTGEAPSDGDTFVIV